MDDRGTASTLVGLVAIGIFIMVTFGVFLSTQTLTPSTLGETVESTQRDLQSESLAQIILGSTGYSGAGDWTLDPDGLIRFGLLEDDGEVSFAKLENLRRAPFSADNGDGFVNYEEAKVALGTGGLDFHIRAAPTLQSVRDILATGIKDQHLMVAYIGDIDATTTGSAPPADPLAGLTVTGPTCSVSPLTSPAGNAYRFAVDITNGGETDTQFNAIWTYTLGTAAETTRSSNSFVVADDGGTTTLYLDVPAFTQAGSGGSPPTACAAGTTMTVEILDTSQTLTSITKTFTASDEVTATTAAPHDLSLSTSKTYYETASPCNKSDEIELEYGSTTADETTQTMALRVADSVGNQVYPSGGGPSWDTFQMDSNVNKRQISIGCLAAGEYTATFQYYSGASPALDDIRVTQNILVTAGSLDPFTPDGETPSTGYTYFEKPAATAEVEIIDNLVENFCPYYFDSATNSPMTPPPGHAARCGAFKPDAAGQQGDVFPDVKDIMNNDLPNRLLNADGTPRYDVTNTLIVGSDVQHNVMTSAAAKHAVRDWVYGGGNLIVLGSVDQSVQWLQPIFHSGIKSSSGGIGTPDPSHPVLRIPDVMDWQGYGNPNGNAWDFVAGSDAYFTFVVAQGTGAVMAISNPGAFQEGNVFLTTYIAHDPYGTGSSGTNFQGYVLMNNLMTLGYRDLYLDYGPPLPDNLSVAPGVRTALVSHPDLGDIAVTFIVFVF